MISKANTHYILDEAHLLLENISLIEICRELNKAGLITTTASDISCLSAFKEYEKINLLAKIWKNYFVQHVANYKNMNANNEEFQR